MGFHPASSGHLQAVHARLSGPSGQSITATLLFFAQASAMGFRCAFDRAVRKVLGMKPAFPATATAVKLFVVSVHSWKIISRISSFAVPVVAD
jgi:hypothetical protein